MIGKDRTAAIVDRANRELRAAGNPARALAEKRYLKSDLEFVGAGVPAIRAVAMRIHKTDPGLDRMITLKIARRLWSEAVFERRLATVELLRASLDNLEPGDLDLIERLIRQSKTWALVDSLATDVTSPLVERHPVLLRTLDRWAADRDFWVRRSALLALLPPLRRGAGEFVRFARYADAMLDEKEFFIRKAIGWVLREVGKKRPQLVYDWIRPRATRVSGVTLREAVKYLPADQQAELVRLYKARRASRGTV